MRCAVVYLAAGSLVTGILAAIFWFRSAWGSSPKTSELKNFMKDEKGFTPLDHWAIRVGWNNCVAAVFSAFSIILEAASSVLGAFIS